MGYALAADLPADIEADVTTREDAIEIASGVIDGYLVLYETPVDFTAFDTSDTLTRLEARFERWCLSIAAMHLTANTPGASEKVVANYDLAIKELERVRAGFERLPLLTEIEAPVRARGW